MLNLHNLRVMEKPHMGQFVADHGWDAVVAELWEMAGDDMADRALDVAALCLGLPNFPPKVLELARHAARIVVNSGSYSATSLRAASWVLLGLAAPEALSSKPAARKTFQIVRVPVPQEEYPADGLRLSGGNASYDPEFLSALGVQVQEGDEVVVTARVVSRVVTRREPVLE